MNWALKWVEPTLHYMGIEMKLGLAITLAVQQIMTTKFVTNFCHLRSTIRHNILPRHIHVINLQNFMTNVIYMAAPHPPVSDDLSDVCCRHRISDET